MFIEQRATDTGMTYLDVILEFCEDNMIEPDDIASKITRSLKAKLETNFRDLNYLPKIAQLDM